MSRSSLLAVCGLVFCAELGQSMLVPLLPGIGRDLALGPAETGVLLSLATLATLVTAVPAGLLAERIGALRVSLAAGVLFAVAAAVQAVATDFPTLLAGRALFGVGFAAIWTAGVTLLTGRDAPAGAVAAAMAAGGLAHLVGPPLSGVLNDAVDRALPFWLLAAAATAVTLLAATGSAGRPQRAPTLGVRAAARAAGGDPALRSAAVVIALVGVLTGLVPLAVPLLLDAEGLSSGAIGWAFAASSLVWVGASAVAARVRVRADAAGAAAAGVLLLAAVALLPVATLAAPALVAFVMVRAAIQAPLSTLSYDLGALGARTAGVAIGTAMGLLNLVWAAGATAAPLLGGVVLAAAGARWVFVLLALACAVTALGLRGRTAAPSRAGRETVRRLEPGPAAP